MATKNKAADDVCKGVDQKSLKSRVSDFHITEIAADLIDWEGIAPFLGLTDAEVVEIKEDYPYKPECQRHKALHTWRWKNGDNSTYKALVDILCSPQVEQVTLAERLINMLTSPDEFKEGSRRHVTVYRKHLIENYNNVPHPARDQWQVVSSDMSRYEVYVDLKLHKMPWSEFAAKGPSESSSSQAVSFEDIFGGHKERKREVIVFEGVGGSGKTTLCWNLRREWAKEHLLQQYHLLIHAQLNDPQLQSATTLADFIVNAQKKEREEVTSYVLDRKGEGICFIFDGLDEASPPLLNSILDLIKRTYQVCLPNLSFIMTTRPNSRIMTEMKQIVESRRILIGGFEIPKLHEFVDLCLESLPSKKQIVRENFTTHPTVEHLCTLPINATTMIHMVQLVSVGDNVSSNKANIYHYILSNYIVRHMRLRTDQKDILLTSKLADLDSLPSQIRNSFKQMCLLAYSAATKGKPPLFTATELGIPPQEKVDNSLGLLCIHRKITMMGEKQYYSFSCHSLQDYLAAIHVLNMDSHDRISAQDGLSPNVLELIELSSNQN